MKSIEDVAYKLYRKQSAHDKISKYEFIKYIDETIRNESYNKVYSVLNISESTIRDKFTMRFIDNVAYNIYIEKYKKYKKININSESFKMFFIYWKHSNFEYDKIYSEANKIIRKNKLIKIKKHQKKKTC